MGNGERRLVDDFWDLRDHAYDHPDRWQEVTADALLHRMIAWRANEGEG